MFMANIPYDLEVLLSIDSINEAADDEARAKLKLLETLSNFTDPFVREGETESDEFQTSITAWNGQLQRAIIDEVREFDITNFDDLEHMVEGDIDEEGYFKGRVKAFGQWHEDVVIKPARAYKVRSDSKFGAFSLRIAAFEAEIGKTTHNKEQHEYFKQSADTYGGLRLYRDSLRVMPYGREDNDYFEIEKKEER